MTMIWIGDQSIDFSIMKTGTGHASFLHGTICLKKQVYPML
jgi:hypothetical protein